MNAPAQLSMFEPEGEEALTLLRRYLREAEQHAASADRFGLLGMLGASARSDALMQQAVDNALVMAMLLDFERESSL